MFEIINLRTENATVILDWEDVERCLSKLLPTLPFKPDVVLGLARGGVIPASLIHRHFPNARFETIQTSSYTGRVAKTTIKVERIDTTSLQGKRILIVDDIYDTGRSLKAVLARLKRVPNASISCCVLVSKRLTNLPLTYAVLTSPHQWVQFPWERIGKP